MLTVGISLAKTPRQEKNRHGVAHGVPRQFLSSGVFQVHQIRKEGNAVQEFTAQYADQIQGVLSGFDRLVFRGSLRQISYPFGMQGYRWANQVPMTRFGAHVKQISGRVKEAALRCVQKADRPVQYLQSSKDDKEAIARAIARKDKVTEGPVCALTCVEPCWGFDVDRHRETKKLDLAPRSRQCLYVYPYGQHSILGWWNARIETWFAFSIQICRHGREWLGRQRERAGIRYQQC